VTPAFLRKNTKIFMAIFGSLLMLTFVVSFGNRGSMFGGGGTGAILGTLNGKEITTADLARAQADLSIGNAFANHLSPEPDARGESNARQRFIGLPLRLLAPNKHPLSLFLILQEARQYGISVSQAEIDGQIFEAKLSPDDLRSMLNELGINQAQFRQAIGDILTISKMVNFVAQGIINSRPQLLHDAAGVATTADAQIVALKTSSAGNPAAPTAEALQAQFDLYKDRIAGPPAADEKAIDGHTFSFGYKYPNRIGLMYIMVPAEAVAKAIPITAADQVEALREFNAHPDDWKPANGSTTQPSTQPVTFEAVRSSIIASIQDQKIQAKEDQIIAALRERLGRLAPAGTQPATPDYDAVAQTVGEQFGIKLTVVKVPGLVTLEDLYLQYQIGQAIAAIGQQQANVAEIAFSLPEFTAAGHTAFFATGREGPTANDRMGNAYLFRVTQADPSHVPATLAEVRTQVTLDLQRKAEYLAHLQVGRSLAQRASLDGLDVVARSQGMRLQDAIGVRRSIFNGQTIKPGPVNEEIGVVPALTDAILKLGLASAPQGEITAVIAADAGGAEPGATTGPAATQNAPTASTSALLPPDAFHSRFWTCSVGIDESLTCYVAQLNAFTPASERLVADVLTNGKLGIADQREESGTMVVDWFALQNLADRVGYVPREPFSATEEAANQGSL
jgi:hypothetical protein